MYKKIDPKLNLAKTEEEILKFWDENKIFEKSLERTKDKEPYTFYDGPPFATGTPHYGHIVASTMKDVVPRYWTMQGRYVERKWGWDCHGLPIENIAEKELGIKRKKQIEEIGVEKFNEVCRSKVLEYVAEWEKVIKRLGRWADMNNSYRTMDLSFMESVWWVFKSLWDRDLIYEGYRSMHICPRCETTLSQSEVTEGYKDIEDVSVIVKFKLLDDDAHILAWTTTPWTLIANVALAVGENINYVKIKLESDSSKYIIAKDRLSIIKEPYEIIEEFKGNKLIGKKYQPLFGYYAYDENLKNRENGWKIVPADFVTTEDGTGVVHMAPAFGEDDMNLGKKMNLPFIQHVSMDGRIKKEAVDFAGLDVKPIENVQSTDEKIVKYLKEKNLLFTEEKYLHSYPHCWRCDTPLLNYATSSWFVAVTKIKDELLKQAEDINWSPKHIKKGRFGKWLEGAKDWSISRQRYWASVIPIWKCGKCAEIKVIGSLNELKENSIQKITKIIFVRHGESEKNVNKISSSSLDKWPLTDLGREQAARISNRIMDKVDTMISSPILRAKETAEILNKKYNLRIEYDDLLAERRYGDDWNDIPQSELLKSNKSYQEYKMLASLDDKFNFRAGSNGETRHEVLDRARKFIKKIIENHPGKTILVVSHGCINAAFSKILANDSIEQYFVKEKVGHDVFIEYFLAEQGDLFDLHKDKIDQIKIKCAECSGEMSRITDVLDTWFDSGSMPYAQLHYPFENKEKFKEIFPAEFIAEGTDQTRAWFYYLHTIATAIFNKPAYKNVIANGIVLAEDGKKMAKRLKNYPDPTEMFNKYGADAVRFYLLSSSVVSADDLNFTESDVAKLYRGMFRMLWSSYSFFVLYANIDNWQPKGDYNSKNVLDKWIISELNMLISDVNRNMKEYNLTKSTRLFTPFIDNLSNWYIRRSRRRFWKSESDEDKNSAYHTLYEVLITLSKLMAPFTPFLSEEIYKNLTNNESVHLENYPEANEDLIDRDLIEQMNQAKKIVVQGLAIRSEAEIKVRQPLSNLSYGGKRLRDEITEVIADEVNTKTISFEENKSEDFVDLDLTISQKLKEEGLVRDLIREIQSLRKKSNFEIDDRIILRYQTEDKDLNGAILSFSDMIKKEVLATEILNQKQDSEGEAELSISNKKIWLGLSRFNNVEKI